MEATKIFLSSGRPLVNTGGLNYFWMSKAMTCVPLVKLSGRNKRFCEEYVVDFNGAGAARRAGYSEASAKQKAYELLQDPLVKDEIKRQQQVLSDKCLELRERMIQELAAIGLSNVQDFLMFDAEGVYLKDSQDIDREKLAAIAEVSQSETPSGTQIKVKFHDKNAAISSMAKMLGLNEPDKLTVNSHEDALDELE